MPAYFIVSVDIQDIRSFARYGVKVRPVLKKYGGRYLARAKAFPALEGAWPTESLALLEFPSMERARAFYYSEDYQTVREFRVRGARSHVILVEGA